MSEPRLLALKGRIDNNNTQKLMALVYTLSVTYINADMTLLYMHFYGQCL